MTRESANPDRDRGRIRAAMRERRRALDVAARIAAARGVRDSLEALPAVRAANRIAGYWAVDGELPLNLAFSAFAARGQAYYLPRIDAGHGMRFVRWQNGDDVAANRYGIPEPTGADVIDPSQLDAVLVPLTAFDRRGARLGAGGGFYDRCFGFLAERARPARPLLVGVGYAFQECPQLDVEPWDIALDYVASERELIDCHQGSPA